MVSHVLEDLQKRKAPTVAPRSVNLFLCNKFRLQHERRPFAKGPKTPSFARIVNHSEPWDPPNCRVLSIYIGGYVADIFRAI